MVNTDENNEGSFGGTRSFGTFNQKPSNGPQNDRPSAAFGGFRGGQGGRGGFASRGGSSGPGTGANRAPLGGARDDGRDFGANDGNNDNKQTADGGSSLRGGFGGRGGRGTGTSGSTGSFGGGRGGSSFSSGAGAGSFGGGRGGGTSFGAGAGTGSFGGGRGGDSTSATGGGSSFAGRGGGGGSSFASRGGGGGSSFSGRGGGNSFGGAGRGGSSFGGGGGTSSFGGDASRTFGRRDDAQDFGAGRNTFGSRFGSGGQGEVSQRREFTSEEERNRERSYIPPERSIEDIVADDTKVKDKYVSIREEDDDVEITGVDSDKYQQMLDNWNDAGFEPKLIENIERSGYTRPRKIQSRTIPLIMDGHDVKGHAETGSGKSAAFLLPIIDQIMKKKKAGTFKSKRISPYAVIIEPSRELAIQLFEQAKKLANGCDVSVERAYGKYFYKENLKAISTNGCDILIGTLGRLFHFFSEELILCGEMKILVLDEADQLLEDESARDLRRIAKTNDWPSIENRQTLLFSATFPEEVHKWAEEWIKPTALLVSNKKLVMANARVLQKFVRVNRSNKNQELLKLFQQELAELKADNPDNDDPKVRSTMVFVKMKRTADVVSTYLNLNKMESTTINGDRPQALRHQALNDFRSGKFQIVVTTDVCARGIDLKDLDHVINMDLPLDYTTYVHRIGRTGRLKEGAATSFFDPTEDVDLAKLLVEGVQRCDQEVPEWLQMYSDGKTPPDDEYQEETNNQTPDPPCPGPSNAEEKENNDVPEATQETVGSENEMAKTEAEVTPSKKAALPAADNNDW